jgi:hypothetical protein
MNNLSETRPPGARNPSGVEELNVWVRLSIPSDPFCRVAFPPMNRIGTQLLSRLLQARMEAAGLLVTRPSLGMEFNSAVCAFTVSELQAALSAIKTELGGLGLLDWAQIAWDDPREGVFRIFHPESGTLVLPSEAERQSEADFIAKVYEQAKRSREAIRQ